MRARTLGVTHSEGNGNANVAVTMTVPSPPQPPLTPSTTVVSPDLSIQSSGISSSCK